MRTDNMINFTNGDLDDLLEIAKILTIVRIAVEWMVFDWYFVLYSFLSSLDHDSYHLLFAVVVDAAIVMRTRTFDGTLQLDHNWKKMKLKAC